MKAKTFLKLLTQSGFITLTLLFFFNLSLSFSQVSEIFYDSGIKLYPYSGVGYTAAIDLADVNKDGLLDIGLGIHCYSDYVFLNKGNNQFQLSSSCGGWGNPRAAYFIDMDNDGDLDFSTGSSSAVDNGHIVISINDGYGNFSIGPHLRPVNPPSSWNAECYIVGDFTGDNLPDLITSNYIFINEGKLSFREELLVTTGTEHNMMVAGDIDNDNDLDYVGGSCVWNNDGQGSFTLNQNLQGSYHGAILIDFNNDGYLDLAITKRWSNMTIIYYNNGNGIFTENQSIYSNNIELIDHYEVGDINKDGWNDLLILGYKGIEIYLNDKTGNLSGPSQYIYKEVFLGGVLDAALGDLNNDGWLDIVFCDYRVNISPFIWYNSYGLNSNPVADAGIDLTIECSSNTGIQVNLDGSNSFDQDNDPLTYTWYENSEIIAGPTLNSISQVSLNNGLHKIELVVEDGRGGIDNDVLEISIIDSKPPAISLQLDPILLWPPNHKMIDIIASVILTDQCDVNPTFILKSIVSNELDEDIGDGDMPNDIQYADIGQPDISFQLRAERSGKGTGRIYTITYEASDLSGNVVTISESVIVPKNGKKLKNLQKIIKKAQISLLPQ